MALNASGNDDRPKSSRGTGFQGQIRGASLADLVQMECLAGSRRVVRVMSGQNSGFLYIRSGAVVHAVARGLTGEAAAMEMLKWRDGDFEPVEREWPAKETISAHWQSLLLRAAQVRDESSRSVVVLRPDGTGKAESQLESRDNGMEWVEVDVTPIEVAGHMLRSEDFEIALRLSSQGTVIERKGGTEEFADIVAYACRLTEILGQLLGIEPFVAMECSFKNSRCFVILEENGEVVALKPTPQADINSMRELFGF
jgi:hypothetical protein